ncbi:GNAT family N-acetyltransferase [Anaeromonas frigoriresistens]|nr:GNAT family N-acetyltransferase [Anaeromonas frigoriresistens]
MNIQYITGKEELIDNVKELWNKLNEYHTNNSKYFSEDFRKYKFEDRSKGLQEKAKEGSIKIDLVKNKDIDKLVGYCISTIDMKNIGEIDSLYIEKEYRGVDIGDKLMKNSIEWLESKEVNSIRIGVSVGNDKVLKFYERYGFYPRVTILQKK